jgi:hypothetical protein
MYKGAGAILGALVLCAPINAQQQAVIASAPQVLVVQKAAVGNSLPSNTEVWVSLNNGLTSKQTKVGDKFDVTVSRDVMMGDYVVIPRGTPGHGQVAYRTGKGAFGKSAKMEFDLVDVKIGERYIPVSGHYRLEGNGNTGAAVGAVVAVGVFGAFVTGHSAAAAQGTEWKAYTKEPIMVAIAQPEQAPVMAAVQAVPPTAPTVQAAVATVPASQPLKLAPVAPGGATLQQTSGSSTTS